MSAAVGDKDQGSNSSAFFFCSFRRVGLLTRLGCVQGLVLLIFLFLYVWLGPSQLWHTGLVILWHAETSWTGDWARIPELAGGYF